MKKILLLCLCILAEIAFGQDRHAILLKNKNNSPFSFSNPSAYLSSRAILRRVNQSIPLDSTDLPVNPSYINQIASTGAAILGKSKWLNAVIIQTSSSSVLNAINALPFVQATINVGFTTTQNGTDKFSSEKLFKENRFNAVSPAQRTAAFNYGPSLNQIQMLGGDLMHNSGYTGLGMLIAIIDAGFNNADNMIVFDSLRAHNRILATWDFVNQNANVYGNSSHGSYVFSIIGGNWPGNIVGSAPDASFLLLRSEYAPTEYIIEEYYWSMAAEFADSAGADVINSSLGYTEFDDPSQNHTRNDSNGDTAPVTIAADFAAQKGMVVCNSAGNEGNNPWHFISMPADADSILTVGAVDAGGQYVGFSGKGPTVDGRVKPNVVAQGSGTYVADIMNGGVFPGNGTSFSSPVMAGMAACLWQCHPQAKNMQIINALQQSATQAGNPDTLVGYGIPNIPLACSILSVMETGSQSQSDVLTITGPNPFDTEIEFAFYSSSAQQVRISVWDLNGKETCLQIEKMQKGETRLFRIPIHASSGLYLLRVQTMSSVFSGKVMKK